MKYSTEHQRQWKKRIEESQCYSGGLAAYCQKAGITVNALSYWRRKLRDQLALLRSGPSSAFIPVQVMTVENSDRRPELPDAKWLADLIRHLATDSIRSSQ